MTDRQTRSMLKIVRAAGDNNVTRNRARRGSQKVRPAASRRTESIDAAAPCDVAQGIRCPHDDEVDTPISTASALRAKPKSADPDVRGVGREIARATGAEVAFVAEDRRGKPRRARAGVRSVEPARPTLTRSGSGPEQGIETEDVTLG
jgi:hypothetical protein